MVANIFEKTGEPSVLAQRAATLGIVIVSWNVRDLLERCLETVQRAEMGADAKVVVVDNASSDGTPAMVRERFPPVVLVENRDNVGFSRANNQGLAALGALGGDEAPAVGHVAGGGQDEAPGQHAPRADTISAPDHVFLLNPDTEIGHETLTKLSAVLDAFPACACVGPMLRYADGALQSSRRRFPSVAVGLIESTPVEWHWPNNPIARRYRMDDVDPSRPAEVDWVVGAAMMLRARGLKDVGGLDEGFFMYSEELDLCRRLADRGWTTRYEPAAHVVHHEGRSSDQVVPARHLRFMRSRVRYFHKHHGWLVATAVRFGILKGYLFELIVESSKWALGHKRTERAERVRAYWAILRDGLG